MMQWPRTQIGPVRNRSKTRRLLRGRNAECASHFLRCEHVPEYEMEVTPASQSSGYDTLGNKLALHKFSESDRDVMRFCLLSLVRFVMKSGLGLEKIWMERNSPA